MKIFWSWVVCLGLLTGCHYLKLLKKQTLTLDASPELELVVYKQVGKNGQKVMNPVGLIRGGQTIDIESGEYLVANECSGYEFKQTQDRPTRIPVRRLKLVLHGEDVLLQKTTTRSNEQHSQGVIDANSAEDSAEQKTQDPASNDTAKPGSPASLKDTSVKDLVHTLCTDPLDQHRNRWTQRRDFDILPGATNIQIGGRLIEVENHGETSEPIFLNLYPIIIDSKFQEIHSRFFIMAEEKNSKTESTVISFEANTPTWLLPGSYSLEVNGTRRKVVIEQGARIEISVGVLRIEMPEHFPLEDRLKAGGQPVFAYLDSGALLNLNTDYLVFPGSYNVSIEGSEVQDVFQVESAEKTVVRTFAARIDAPVCPAQLKTCKNVPRVTIHRDQKPYALMSVEPRLPFLLLEGNYEYGVEGLRGIKRSLQKRTDSLAGEALARVRLKWDVRQAQGRYRTDLVRIESRGPTTFGRSLDLLFHKPEEVYVPPGIYELTYFVGDPVLERSKSKLALHLEPGQTREVMIPIYIEKPSNSDDGQSNPMSRNQNNQNRVSEKFDSHKNGSSSQSNDSTPATLPRALTPLRR